MRYATTAIGTLLCGLGTTAGAESTPCEAVPAVVEAARGETAESVCAALWSATAKLHECGLRTSRVYTIRVVSRIEDAWPDCLGRYVCETRVIEVVGPDHLPEAIVPESLLDRIEPMALFASLVVHEWAHAVLDEVTQNRVRDLGDQEFVAFAMSMSTLDAQDRQLWLDAFPTDEVPERAAINGTVAAMNPLNFAARAWRYFEANGGCQTVRAIVDGEASFRSGRQ